MECLGFILLLARLCVGCSDTCIVGRHFLYLSVLSICLSLPALCCPAVCVAECNCDWCVQQFASVSSSRGSGVQL
jgi:hypothetical protein